MIRGAAFSGYSWRAASHGVELGGAAAEIGVAIGGLRAAACRIAAAGIQTRGQVGELLLEGTGEGGEVAVVGSDQRRGGLVVQVVRKSEDRAGLALTLGECGLAHHEGG